MMPVRFKWPAAQNEPMVSRSYHIPVISALSIRELLGHVFNHK